MLILQSSGMPDFLTHLKDIGKNPFIFIAYIFVIFAWVFYIYLNKKINLIKEFKDEKNKLTALEKLIKEKPPKNVDQISWYELKLKEKKHNYYFLSYISTLLTIIIIVTITLYKTNFQNNTSEGNLNSKIDSTIFLNKHNAKDSTISNEKHKLDSLKTSVKLGNIQSNTNTINQNLRGKDVKAIGVNYGTINFNK